MIFSNGVLGADEMLGSIEGRLVYETLILFRLIADDHPHLQWPFLRFIPRDVIHTLSPINMYNQLYSKEDDQQHDQVTWK
ncbi:hypothetical protein ACS0PU_001486 [Formica fusca]